jgi:hypothetical protein
MKGDLISDEFKKNAHYYTVYKSGFLASLSLLAIQFNDSNTIHLPNKKKGLFIQLVMTSNPDPFHNKFANFWEMWSSLLTSAREWFSWFSLHGSIVVCKSLKKRS